MCPCGQVPPSPLKWLPFLPLVAAVLITPEGAESPGSGRIGVTGALGIVAIESRVPQYH